MSDEKKTLGFCSLCMQNVEHTRKFSSIFMRLLDVLTLGLLGVFRIGPYYCFQCENKTLFLRRVRREAPTFDSITSIVDFSNPKHDRRRPQASANESLEIEEAFEPVGNFLKAEHSLLRQERRASNFSQKFRDGVVMKILSGKSSIHEVHLELGITETDLTVWIGEMMKRKDQRIDELEKALEAIQSNLHVKITALNKFDLDSDGTIIEGRVANQ